MTKPAHYTGMLIALLLGYGIPTFATPTRATTHPPDSAFLFAYSTDDGRSGLRLAWSLEREQWHAIDQRFLPSDFGSWGSQKRMFSPYLLQDDTGLWHCVWSLNDTIQQVAHAASENLFEWQRQAYPVVMTPPGNVREPELIQQDSRFLLTWRSAAPGYAGYYQTTTTDFQAYTPTQAAPDILRRADRVTVPIGGDAIRGQVVKVAWSLIDGLLKQAEWERFHQRERAERMVDDPVRFADLQPVSSSISLRPEATKEISDLLMGIFFEDISYAADGGLYAELIQNRDFEYHPRDNRYRDSTWNSKMAWTLAGAGTFDVRTGDPIHPNNPHYAALDIRAGGTALINSGWDGIPVAAGKQYDLSVFARSPRTRRLTVRLLAPDGRVIGAAEIRGLGKNWKKYTAVITATETVADARLEVAPSGTGRIDLDLISLFPRHTFQNRRNGLRADLAQAIADLHPKFVRFPGGCVAHGDGLENIYRWENTIGPLESRVPQRNIWGYHQTAGLGYYEYFQFCEDIGAEPIPIVAAGVPCQNSSTGGHGQQCGIPLEEMDEYVQSVLDLIEWANGAPDTEWGRKRAAAGHPEPFGLKYLGIGNEDQITDVFEERFRLIYAAVRTHHPEITVIGTAGPFYRGTDYEEGWAVARELEVPIVDEHYYQPPGWFINNQDYYDRYDRHGPQVYLGEYAAHLPGRRMNIETALSEALYLTAVERNADIVRMTSFAPLLAKEDYTDWNPDLIYFDNTAVHPTVDYYVQQLFGQNSGTLYVPTTVTLSDNDVPVRRRIGVSAVRETAGGDLILKLVNLLPVAVPTSIDLSPLAVGPTGTLTLLRGDPTDEAARPVTSEIAIREQLNYTLPGYSFAVIRVPVR